MKKIFATSLLLLFSGAAFVACDDNKNDDPTPQYDVISFEPAEHMAAVGGKEVSVGDVTLNIWNLGGDYTYKNAFCGASCLTELFDGDLFTTADGTVKFASYYDPQYSMWGGIAVAAAPDMTVSEQPIAQQFSVWAEGGANNTATYAVCYDSNTPTEAYPDYLTASGYPTITFSAARTVDHLWIANSSYVCSWFSGNDKALFVVKITGQKNGVETGSVTETLISGSDVLSGWRKVNLLSLGEIDRLTFKVSGIDVTADPTYFCIDEITLVK